MFNRFKKQTGKQGVCLLLNDKKWFVMEIHDNNAKILVPSDNGKSLKSSGPPGNDAASAGNASEIGEKNEAPVNKNAVVPDEKKVEAIPKKEEQLSPILEVSQRFMSNLRKAPGKRGAMKDAASMKSSDEEKNQALFPQKKRDWDTRLFVLSTLKRLVDREHFEELEEEDSRMQLTREALLERKRLMEGRDQRQRRRTKDEKLMPTSRLTKVVPDEIEFLNTRDKQRIEKTRQLKQKEKRTKAGMALNEALLKVAFIKEPHPASEISEKTTGQQQEVTEQKNEITEQKNEEVKEQKPKKRGLFNFR